MKEPVTSLVELLLVVFVVIEMLIGDTEVKIHKAVREMPNTKIRIPPTIVKMAIMVTPVGLFCFSNVFHFSLIFRLEKHFYMVYIIVNLNNNFHLYDRYTNSFVFQIDIENQLKRLDVKLYDQVCKISHNL